MIEIEEKEVIDTRTIKKLRIEIVDIIFNLSARFRVMLYDMAEQLIKSVIVLIEGEDYKKWGNDDDIILDLVLVKLGLSLPPQ
jgi:hypothetical protein